MVDERETAQTSSARKLNSHAPPCWVLAIICFVCTFFAFKPLQLTCLVDPNNLETLGGMGGVDAQLHGLGTHSTHGLSIKATDPPTHLRHSVQLFKFSRRPTQTTVFMMSGGW